ncbi:DNA-directed RNA polymerase subunit N [Candidatus Micrarchaeota archaeon]|nr:DNA-directed RNA polymerase subunit N [Candidatus Micrarchaeota archaeon]
MMPSIRCFTCGKPIADRYAKFKQSVSEGSNPAEVLNNLGVERYCCKRMFLSETDLIDEIKPFPRF